MVFDKTGEAQLAMERGAPVSYFNAGRQYIVYLDGQRTKDGKTQFHFSGTRKGGTEKIEGWDDPIKFSVIE